MSRAAIVVAALAALACRNPTGAGRTPLRDPIVADSGDARGRLLRELEAEVRASYERRELDAGAAAAAIDPAVGLVAIGVGPADLAVRMTPAVRWPIVAVTRTVDAPAGPRLDPVAIVSRALEVYLSTDETVGWAFDEATLELPVCGRVATIPIRIFQVYVRDSDRWALVAEHLAYAQAMGRWLDAAVGPDGAPLTEAIERQPEAVAARAAIGEAIAPDGDRTVTWSDGPEALAVWPDAAHVLRGGAVRTGPSLPQSLDATELTIDGIRIALGPGRAAAIASATLLATVERAGVGGGPVQLRFRGTFVAERDGDGPEAAWRVHAAMVSIPITAGALVGRTVGVTAGAPNNGVVATQCR